MPVLLGDILVDRGIITPHQRDTIVAEQLNARQQLGA
jgi:hypothetical protein